MTAPINTKTVRVLPETHTTLHNIAADLNGSADDAIRWLLDPNMVRVRVTPEQLERWSRCAAEVGIPVNEWVTYRVEAALQFGSDPTVLHSMFDLLKRIHRDTRDPNTK